MTTAPPPTAQIRVEPAADTCGVVLIDDIQGLQVPIETAEPVQPRACAHTEFCFPIDAAYRLDSTTFSIPVSVNVIVRDSTGTVVAHVPPEMSKTVSAGQHTIEIGALGIKTYLSVHGEIRIDAATEDGRTLTIPKTDQVSLGVRSLHTQPAATITTTDDPESVMRAVSCFGSALKTTSCERSFPSLRGHPPRLERGDRFHAPGSLERTREEADIRLEVPSTFESVYPAASLAYYLDAAVVPGTPPQIVANGSAHTLEGSDGYEATVARILKHVFTLDCVTRTEGFYPIRLSEREHLEATTALDFAELYDRPLAEQVNAYLSIPFETVEPVVPRWPLTTTLSPAPDKSAYLPYVAADLSCIRTPQSTPIPESAVTAPYQDAIEEFLRARTTDQNGADDAETSALRGSRTPDRRTRTLKPASTESITHLWLDEGYPIAGAKPTLNACRRRLDANPSGPIDVVVISNAPEMRAEADVADLYGLRDLVAFDVTVHEELTSAALREVFATDHDLVHYVGHVDNEGLQCADGWLDADTIEHVDTRAFILNGCRSVEQGTALVETGAIGGLCTLRSVGNSPATDVGRTVARLLNAGFSLGGALDVIADESVTGHQYMVVGDPRLTITTCKGPTPNLVEIRTKESDQYDVSIYGSPVSTAHLGTLSMPHLRANETYYLNSGHIVTKTVSASELRSYLALGRIPVRLNGNLTWSDRLTSVSLTSDTNLQE